MSEAPDQPVEDVAASAIPSGVDAAAPAATDDIETDAFDRMEVPDDETDHPAGDGDGDPDKPKPEDDIEVETKDGTKLKVPAALKDFLLRQDDYTKKTQDLAAARRVVDEDRTALETQRAQQAESVKALRAEHIAVANHETSIAALDTQLAEYRKLSAADWTTLRADNSALYTQHADNYDFLKRTRDASADALTAAKTDLTTKEAALATSQQEARNGQLAKAWAETNTALTAKIEGWSPTKGTEIGKFMVEKFGVRPEELREATDPRIWIMADELMRAQAQVANLTKTSKQATATKAALQSQQSQPAAKPASGGAKPTGVTDRLSDDEWFRRRAAQKARKSR